MSKHTDKKSYPIRHYVKIMMIVTASALLLDLIISVASISIVKQQSTQYLQDTADLYLTRINHDFAYINHYMGWTLANDESVESLDDKNITYDEFLESSDKLRKRYTELQKNYGPEYQFFFYYKEKDLFLNYAPMKLSYPEYEELRQQMMTYTEDPNLYEKYYSNWTPIQIKQKYYMINLVPYHDKYFICLISADDLIDPLRQINLGKNGFSSLVDQDGLTLSSPNMATEEKGLSLENVILPRTTVMKPFLNSPVSVKMVIRFGAFEKIMIAQLLIILLFLILACTLCIVILYFKNKVLTPIQNFSKNLRYLEEEEESLDFRNSQIIELEQANMEFHNLVQQIKKFKIEVYEQELSKQKIQLDYMKLQIRPHFFLNCLTNIYSMAQMEMYEEIEYMSLSTSKYFRYIFQNDGDYVDLDDELDHIRTFLGIQKHRYRDAFTYEIEQADDTKRMVLPPLILQTFIENAVKYAVSRDHSLQISVEVSALHKEAERLLVIEIQDTGPGFPTDILAKLQHKEQLESGDGHQIGIKNTLQRLEFIYDGKAVVEFSNKTDGGACIRLLLPQPMQAATLLKEK
ncbi:histidine kinase [Paenibacillus sp. Marseille-Q4541]|uniref:sensor histidine kinase n=1 Tax=Paenibacillus sp. Marseille-Q4541 TaxID=2831522 RepID=UPI001BABED90|nr:histidine kinase [Paenibacillus sp. Marseille-Q4541]